MSTYTPHRFVEYSAEFFQIVTWVVMRGAFLIFGKLTVTGLENIRHIRGSVIFAPNHTNDMDPIFLRTALPIHSTHTPVHFVTMPFKEYGSFDRAPLVKLLYKMIPFGLIGAVPLVSGARDYAVSLANHIALLRKGKSVCIFPEGRVSKDGSIGEPRGGVAYMAQVTHRPIIPVTISGAYNLGVIGFFAKRPHITIHFGKPCFAGDIVPTAYPPQTRYRKATAHVLQAIRRRLQRIQASRNSS